MKTNSQIWSVIDGDRILFYGKLSKVTKNGISATLLGYRKNGMNFWY